MAESDDAEDVLYYHLNLALKSGRLTPFLGAGVNLVGIDMDEDFQPGSRAPSSGELAAALAKRFRYPGTGNDPDLLRVAQWVFNKLDSPLLYEYLHSMFDHDFPATPLHDVIASMPAVVRSQPIVEHPLIITTNYDDVLERAFTRRGEPYDVLTYVATGDLDYVGRFRHTDEDGNTKIVSNPANAYPGVNLTERSAILKLHGAIRRSPDADVEDDSYVLTEDDYIECLTRTDIVDYLPSAVVRRMKGCHYLFLGYSLRDWNLRAMLRRIQRDQTKMKHRSWAIVSQPDKFEVQAWERRGVEIHDIDLATFAARLASELGPVADRTEVT